MGAIPIPTVTVWMEEDACPFSDYHALDLFIRGIFIFVFPRVVDMEGNYMEKALELAKKGLGKTNPNPMVGAVIVKDKEIVAEGFHEAAGKPHAEVNALNKAKNRAKGATMYVTLEPCVHHGKTPPCADAIIESGIERVVIGSTDPSPLVAEKGVEKLKKAGIKVETGVLDEKNQKLNEIFFHFMKERRPFIVMKSAMSADGKTATKTLDAKWITNESSRRFVHELRTRLAAVMVGANTVIADDPLLTARHEEGCRQPVRIIVDAHGEIPLEAKVLDTSASHATWIVTTLKAPKANLAAFESKGARLLFADETEGGIDFSALMKRLAAENIDSILVEGGSLLNASLIEAGVVDRLHLFIAPKIIGGNEALTPVGGEGVAKVADAEKLTFVAIDTFDGDVMVTYDFKGGDK